MRNPVVLLPCTLALLTLPMAAAPAEAQPAGPPARTREAGMPEQTPPNAGSPVTRRNPPTLWNSTENGHSQISVAEPGRLAFLSGQTAARPGGGAERRDLAGQARQVAANLAAALKELGSSPRDIVLLRVYVVDATTDRFKEALLPIREMLGGEMPSVTAIGVQALWTPELQLEVEMVVRVP